MLTGKHLIDGQWVSGKNTFNAVAADEGALVLSAFADGDEKEADAAARAAEESFAEYAAMPLAQRAEFLRAIAREIDALGDEITEVAGRETALPAARLTGERARTTGQLNMFAGLAESGAVLDSRKTSPLPDRTPPRPGIVLQHHPVGPAAIFGASNFPLAFSAAGGDTASALAAGCTVVVKGHPSHPGTGELTAQAICTAARACGVPSGVYSLVQGKSPELSRALVSHPLIQAVGFTGSLSTGKALYEIASTRPQPIPFYGEMGSINPVFVLPGAVSARTAEIAAGWVESLVLGAGQFCTNPGVVFCTEDFADVFTSAAMEKISTIGAHTMLSTAIAKSFKDGVESLSKYARKAAESSGGAAIFTADLHTWLAEESLHREVFGPAGVVVRCSSDAMLEVARGLEGQLTATIHADAEDGELVRKLLPVLARKAGRLVCNGFPTGVEVCEAMMHGGPYPASTHSGFTSVGELAVRRFLRPVCYQNFSENVLPHVAEYRG